jgi:hypothetical protein
MVLSRRSLLGSTVAVGALAGPLSWLAPADAQAATRTSPDRLTREAFAQHLHEPFRISGHGGRATVRLQSVADIAGAPKGSDRRFTAMFRASRRHRRLEQGVYFLARPGYGRVHVLVVPVGRGVRANVYQVIVNNI